MGCDKLADARRLILQGLQAAIGNCGVGVDMATNAIQSTEHVDNSYMFNPILSPNLMARREKDLMTFAHGHNIRYP